MFVEFGRKKLRLPHRAGPGAAHVIELDVALLHQLERKQEFLGEHLLAPAGIGLRREHADRVMRELVRAIGGLAAPDREHDFRRHAEALLDRAQRDAMVGGELAALIGEARQRDFAQVIRRHLDEFGLAAGLSVRAASDHEIGQLEVRLQAARHGFEGRARHAERLRPRPQAFEPARKRGIRGR